MDEESKTIYGQAWVFDNKVLQDQITIFPNGTSEEKVVTIIPDIWDDLFSSEGEYKTNGKGYFYWEVQMTDIGDDDITVPFLVECPKPRDVDYDRLLDNPSGEWAEYWAGKYNTALKNAEDKLTIQKKEIVFPGSTYLDQNGVAQTIDEIRETNYELGSIANLLSMF